MTSAKRLRRLRKSPTLRAMVTETRVHADDLIQPLFVAEGKGIRREISSMPGVFNFSIDRLEPEVEELQRAGVRAVLLFGLPDPAEKNDTGTAGYDENGIIPRAVRRLKELAPDILVITDVCLCEYTDHGHCGVLSAPELPCPGTILNDETVELLARMAVVHAQAGADMIAPSDMMDLRVGAIREALDDAEFAEIPIMSYATKFASAFYGPFREAAQSAPAFGDRKSHQLNPANVREALRQAAADLGQGADILMVKPALPYLDILATLRQRYDVPLAAYHVSGEYAMLKAAAAKGWIDEARAVWETLTSIKRAGADLIITYYAKDYLSRKLAYDY